MSSNRKLYKGRRQTVRVQVQTRLSFFDLVTFKVFKLSQANIPNLSQHFRKMNSFLKLIFATCILACFTNTGAIQMTVDFDFVDFPATATTAAIRIQSNDSPATLVSNLLHVFINVVHVRRISEDQNLKNCRADLITEWAEADATPETRFDRRGISALLILMIRQLCDIGRSSALDLQLERFAISIKTNRRAVATSTAALTTCQTMMNDCGRWNGPSVPGI